MMIAANGSVRRARPRGSMAGGELADIKALYTSSRPGRAGPHRLVRLFDIGQPRSGGRIDGPEPLPYKPRKIVRWPERIRVSMAFRGRRPPPHGATSGEPET